MRRRTRIIGTYIALGAAGALASVALIIYASWQASVLRTYSSLESLANQVREKADSVFLKARTSLGAIEASQPDPSCSTDHIAQMRAITISTPTAEEVGYVENGLLKCTSWGLMHQRVEKNPTDFISKSGVAVSARVRPWASPNNHMVAVQYGSHNILIEPSRFIDVPSTGDISVVLASDSGIVIAASNANAADLLKLAHTGSAHGMDDSRVYVVDSRDGLMALATTPRSQVVEAFRSLLRITAPIAALVAAAFIAFMTRRAKRRLSPLEELKTAIRDRELSVQYQPILDLQTAHCTGAEALVRWIPPHDRPRNPAHFIALAEENGLIQDITRQVVEHVFSDLGPFLANRPDLHISINLGAADIVSGDTVATIIEQARRASVSLGQVWLEATERGFMDLAPAQATCENAREHGFIVAIDDFGTGYSSLQYLQNLPVDVLKIDQSFVQSIGLESTKSTVVDSIIQMAKGLGLTIVAEGIETEEQAEYLRQRGVDLGQGWLYSKALPAGQFIDFCAQRAARGVTP